ILVERAGEGVGRARQIALPPVGLAQVGEIHRLVGVERDQPLETAGRLVEAPGLEQQHAQLKQRLIVLRPAGQDLEGARPPPPRPWPGGGGGGAAPPPHPPRLFSGVSRGGPSRARGPGGEKGGGRQPPPARPPPPPRHDREREDPGRPPAAVRAQVPPPR